MNADVKKFILQHRKEISTKNYKSIFEEASVEVLGKLVKAFDKANIDYLSRIDKIYPYMYDDRGDLSDIVLPKHITSIDQGAYWGSSIKSIVLDGVQRLGANAFEACLDLETVIIKTSYKLNIGGSCFYGDSKLKNITLPDTTEVIGPDAFQDCDSLEIIDLPKELNYIGSRCFKDCENLTQVTIPGKVTQFGKKAFYGCLKLNKVIYKGDESNLAKVKEMFDHPESIEFVLE